MRDSRFVEGFELSRMALVLRADCSINAGTELRLWREEWRYAVRGFDVSCGRAEGSRIVIRLAISCDICGAEKKQTNHWFVAYEHGEELRIGGWNARFCKKAGARHLCGQTCLHKLVDEFMAQTIAEDRAAAELGITAAEPAAEPHVPEQRIDAMRFAEDRLVEAHGLSTDVSLTSSFAHEDEFGSSARLIRSSEPVSDLRPAREAETPRATPASMSAEEAPKYASHQWRASAWERERERGQQNEAGPRRHKF